MKKKVLILLMAFFSIATVLSQTKGDKSFGGGLGIGVSAILGEGLGFGITLSPQFNYFLADNCNLGLSVGYQFQLLNSHVVLFQPSFNYYVKMVDGLYYAPGISLAGGYANASGYGMGVFGAGLELFTLEFRPTQKLGIGFNALSLNFIGLVDNSSNIITSIDLNINSNSSLVFKYYF